MRTHTAIRTLSILALAVGLVAGSLAIAWAIPVPKKKADPQVAELKPETAPEAPAPAAKPEEASTDAPPSPEPPADAEAAQPPPAVGGEKTSFVYDAAGRPDPMSLPWTMLRLEANNQLAVSTRAVAECKTPALTGLDGLPQRQQAVARAEAALERVRQIDAQMTAKGYRVSEMTDIMQKVATAMTNVEAERTRIASEKRAEQIRIGNLQETPELPKWVKENTEIGGILWSEAEPVCMIGTYALKVGDPVPSYPHVIVHRITKYTVVYLVQDVEFAVSLVDPKEGE